VYLIGVHLTGVYLMGVHFMGVHRRMQPFLLSRTYIFAAFGGPAFLILALSGNLTLGPITRCSYPPHPRYLGFTIRPCTSHIGVHPSHTCTSKGILYRRAPKAVPHIGIGVHLR
jgi:hypothetical protein